MYKDISSATKNLGVMPMVKHYISELKLHDIFRKHIPMKPNEKLEPAQVLNMMLLNIICASRPLYRVQEWLTDYTDGISEKDIYAAQYNDDRLGRNLDKLFKADRSSMLTELSANAIKLHNLQTDDIHNDSTSVTFTGEYENSNQANVNLARGFNKDHRPDCKQIVFGLNITSDGNVPLSFQLFDGNKTDDKTHIPNWDELRKLMEKEDFIYIADCKLCCIDNLNHIHKNGGIFITIVPKNRKEIKAFHKHIQKVDVEWENAMVVDHSRKKGEKIIYRTFEQDKTQEGYRIIWVHSSSKKEQDKKRREHAIEKSHEQLTAISQKLNKYKLKTKEQIEAAIKKACRGASSLFDIDLIEEKKTTKTQITPGRPGPNTRYKETQVISFKLEFVINDEAVAKASRTDGIFPLITNSSDMPAVEVLKKYKNQPYLEKRMYTAKSILKVAPVFLESPRRIEAMLFLYFIALMIVGLIERNIRKKMKSNEIEKLPILPGGMKTKTPTWNNVNNYFRNVHLSVISKGKTVLSSTIKGLNDVHYGILDFLGVPAIVYQNVKDQWWLFEPTE